MSTPETPLMRRGANRLRHAMEQLQKATEQVHEAFYLWADAVRETAEWRVGSAETDDVLTDPIYDRALALSPYEVDQTVHEWCRQMRTELDGWRSTTSASAASRADADARRAATAPGAPNLDAPKSDETEAGGQT